MINLCICCVFIICLR